MAVYVDDMKARFGRMVMSHMIADNDYELHDMADKIGVNRKWWQSPDKASSSHYDISQSKKKLAIDNGAIDVSYKVLACMVHRRKKTGNLGNPEDAVDWMYNWRNATPDDVE